MTNGEFSTLPGIESEKKAEVKKQEAQSSSPTAAQPTSKKGEFPLKMLISLIIVIALLVGVAAYLGYMDIPGITPKKGATTTKPTPAPQPTPTPTPPEEEEEMPPPLPDE